MAMNSARHEPGTFGSYRWGLKTRKTVLMSLSKSSNVSDVSEAGASTCCVLDEGTTDVVLLVGTAPAPPLR
jgi:hypothetical protein